MPRLLALSLLLISFSACKTFYKPINQADERTTTLRAIGGQAGNAVHYPAKDEGELTASGEVYAHNAFTAAHKSLPFGTMVYVVNTENGNKAQVRINDRLTDTKNNTDIILLSGAAAQQLDMLVKGRAKVQVFEGEPQVAQALSANNAPLTAASPVVATAPAIQRPTVPGRYAQPDQQLDIYNNANSPVASVSPTTLYAPQTNPYPVSPYPSTPSRSAMPPVVIQPSNTYSPTPQIQQNYPVIPQTQPNYPPPPTYTPTPYQQAPQQIAPQIAPQPVAVNVTYTVQAIVHGTKAKAEEAAQKLGTDGWIQEINSNGRKMFRVLYGQYQDRGSAESAKAKVRAKYPDAILRDMADL